MANTPHKLTPEAMRTLRKQRKRFLKKFGREPTADDPVFFDPNGPSGPNATPIRIEPDELRNEILEAMRKAGTPPEIVYAYAKTGLLLTEDNLDNYSAEARAEWTAAINEYTAMAGAGKRPQ